MSYDTERALARDHAADEIERCRMLWHEARTTRDQAWRDAEAAVRAMLDAEAAYRAAVAAYEAVK